MSVTTFTLESSRWFLSGIKTMRSAQASVAEKNLDL